MTFSLFNLYHDLNPPTPRAKLTIYIENYRIYFGTVNELNFEIFGDIVNDSPLSVFIKRWKLFISINMTYRIVTYTFTLRDQSLSPSEEVSFTMGQGLLGQNDTRLPENAIRSCLATIWYEDHIGMQITEKEYGFI